MRFSGKSIVLIGAAMCCAVTGKVWADAAGISLPVEIRQAAAGAYAPGSLYGAAEADYVLRGVPGFSFGSVLGTSAGLFKGPSNVDGGGAELSLGYMLPAGLIPSSWGGNARVEASAAGFRGEAVDRNVTTRPRFANATWFFVGGIAPLNTGTNFGGEMRTEQHNVEFALRGATDVAMGPSLILTPAVQLFAARTLTKYTVYSLDACAVGNTLCFEDGMQEQVRQRDIGIGPSVGGKWGVTDSLSLLFGGSVAAVYSNAHMSATDCFDATAAIPGCQRVGVAGGSAATDRDSHWGGRVGALGGARYDVGFGAVEAIASATYQTAVAGIHNPQAPREVANIKWRGEYAGNFGVRLVVPFGGL